MEKVQLIAMDMDGTLLGKQHGVIPEGNIAALRMAHERGIHLAICSGRMPDDSGFFALDAGLDMHIIALNGGCTVDRPLGRITRSQYIDTAAAKGVFALLKESGVQFGIFSNHDLTVSAETLTERDVTVIWGTNLLRSGGRSVLRKGGEGAEELIQRGVSKFVAFSETDSAALLTLRKRLAAEYPQVEVTSSWVNNIEINPRGVNKGTALAALAEELGVPMAETMAIGDNDNDVPMLEAAGIGVAMANSSKLAMAAATYATLSNTECGVAAAIRAIALGEKVEGVRWLK